MISLLSARRFRTKTRRTVKGSDAIEAGANPETLEMVGLEEIPLAYLPGDAVRVKVKAAGDLAL